MPHERLNALLASFIPLLPLLYQRNAQDVDWGNVVTHTKPFAPRYLPPVLELPNNQAALVSFYNHASNIDVIFGPRWFQDVISQPLDTYLPVVDALGAICSHFQVNVAAPSLLLWALGLLFLALVLLFDPPDISTSNHGKIVAARESGLYAEDSSVAASFPSTSASPESLVINLKLVLGWPGMPSEPMPLQRFGTTSTSFALTPIEAEEVMEHATTSHPPTSVAEANNGELALLRSPSDHVSPSPSLRSSASITSGLASLALSYLSTPSHPTQAAPFSSEHASQYTPASVQEQSLPSHRCEMDASSTSSDFTFTVIPPSTSDLESVADLGSPSLSQDAETCLSPAVPDVPSTMISAQIAPPLVPIPPSSMYHTDEIVCPESFSQLEEMHDSETSIGVSELRNVPVFESSAIPLLVEGSLPAMPTIQPCPSHFRALSNITEITEPSDASDSTPGTPRAERFSGIQGRSASLDHDGLSLQVAHDVADDTTRTSTPEVDVAFDWSQVEIPLGMDDFLPLSTSTPNLQSTFDWSIGSIGDSLRRDVGAFQVERVPSPGLPGDLTDIGIPGLPAPLVHPAGLCDAVITSSPSCSVHTDLKEENDEVDKSFEDRTAASPSASVIDFSSDVRSPPRRVAMNTNETALKTSVSTTVSPTITRTSILHLSFGNTSPLASSEVEPAHPTTSLTEAALETSLQTRPPMLLDQQTPTVTRVRRPSRVLVARTGIAGQQVALTDAGLAQLVARLDEPLPPEEDVRGERRRIERATSVALADHLADRGEPRDMYEVIHERRYANEPIAARVERDIVNAAQHPPLKNDPHIRIPVCELGRSRSSSHARSTTNVALVRRPSVSTSLQDVSSMAASPLVLPRTWGHRRSHSEVVDSRTGLVMNDREPRPSYAAIAARGLPSQPLRLPIVSNQPLEPSSLQNTSKIKEAAVETVKGKSRAVSTPAMSMSPEFDAQASWRRGNRWSVLAAPASPSSVEGNFTLIGKGKARLQELPSPAMTAPYRVLGLAGSVPEKRWPQSRLPRAPIQAPSSSVGEAPKAAWVPLSSLDKDSDLRASGSGASKMHGSMLSAISRVQLRDLALSARQSVAASPTVTRSLQLASQSNLASGSAPGSAAVSGPGVTASTSGSSSGGSESVVVICSGATCVPASFAQPGLVVTDKAPAAGQPNADLADTSGDHPATPLESLWLLPARSTAEVHLDESADLVVASQECRPPSPTGDCPAVVRLNARSGSLTPPRVRRATAPAHVLSASTLAADDRPHDPSSRASTSIPFRRDLIPQSTVPRELRQRHVAVPRPPRAFPGHQRATSSTLPKWDQRLMRLPTGSTWRDGRKS